MSVRRDARAPRVSRLDDRGAVAAEFAVTLPAALLVVLVGVGALAAGVQTVRLQGGAADAARLIARGDAGAAEALVEQLPGAAAMRVDGADRLVCVTLTAPVPVPGLIATGPGASARACAASGGR